MDKIENTLMNIGDSHSLVWQLLGLTILLVAGELFNRALIVIPESCQDRIPTPYKMRRNMWVCNSLMMLSFTMTIFIPWWFPYIVPDFAEPDYWTEDVGDDANREGAKDERAYSKINHGFGDIYVTNETAYRFLCWSYIAWTLAAIASAILEFIKCVGAYVPVFEWS